MKMYRVEIASLDACLWDCDGRVVEWQAPCYDDVMMGARFLTINDADLALYEYFVDNDCEVVNVTDEYFGIVRDGGDLYWLLSSDCGGGVISVRFVELGEEF